MYQRAHNKSLHWIFTPLRSVKTSEFGRSTMKDKAMNRRKIQQNNLATITPAAFYTNEKDKIKFNWFLFEYAAELDSHIKRPLRKRLIIGKLQSFVSIILRR